MWQVAVTLLIGLVGLVAIYLYQKLKRPTGFPPGPNAVPMLGSMPFMDMSSNYYEALSKLADIYGPIYSVAFGHKWIVVINDYPTMKEAMVKNSITFAGRIYLEGLKYENPYHPFQGILNETYSEQWKLQRSTTLQILRGLGYGRDVTQNITTEEAEFMAKTFQENSANAIDIQDHLSNAVANVIMSLLFGKRFDYEDKQFKEERKIVEDVFQAGELSQDYDYTPMAYLFPSCRKNLRRFIEVEKHYIQMIKRKISEVPEDSSIDEPRNFVEGYRIERRKNPQISNRLHQILSDFIQAGFETTSTTLGWCIYFMIANPDIQTKVQEELDRVVGRDRKPKLSDRESLPFVEATILEALRFGRIAPITPPHETLQDVNIGGYFIPKGTEVWGNLWYILMDKNVWSEPEAFKPERFINAEGQVVKPEQFVPFGVGRRACLGEQLAKQELFIFFTHIMHSFRVRIADGEKVPEPIGVLALTHCPPKFKINVTCRD